MLTYYDAYCEAFSQALLETPRQKRYGPRFQGAHHAARGIMSVHRLLECQPKDRHWQSNKDFQKERILMSWKGGMLGAGKREYQGIDM